MGKKTKKGGGGGGPSNQPVVSTTQDESPKNDEVVAPKASGTASPVTGSPSRAKGSAPASPKVAVKEEKGGDDIVLAPSVTTDTTSATTSSPPRGGKGSTPSSPKASSPSSSPKAKSPSRPRPPSPVKQVAEEQEVKASEPAIENRTHQPKASSWANIVKQNVPTASSTSTTTTTLPTPEQAPVPEMSSGGAAPEEVVPSSSSTLNGQEGAEMTPEDVETTPPQEEANPPSLAPEKQEEASPTAVMTTSTTEEASPESTEGGAVQQPEVVSQQEEREQSPEVVVSPGSPVKEVKEGMGPEVDSADSKKVEAGSNEGEEVKAGETKPEAAPEKPITLGQEVETTWGRGIVRSIREDGVYEVKGNSWKMAGGQTPTYFLQRKELREVTPYTIWKWSTFHKIERAKELKEEGTRLFRGNDVETASKKYEEAITYLRMTNDDAMNNKEKAQKLEVLIPVLNNVASCGIKLKRFKDAVVAASTTVRLIDEIFKNREAEVMKQLVLLGISEEQIFVTWKRKAAYMSGKCFLQVKEYEKAISFLELARKIVVENGDQELKSAEGQDIQKLLQTAQAYQRAETRQQQGIWSKALSSFSEEEAKLQEANRSSSPPNPATSSKAGEPTKISPAKKTPKKSKALTKAGGSWWRDNQEWVLPLSFLSVVGMTTLGIFYWNRRKK